MSDQPTDRYGRYIYTVGWLRERLAGLPDELHVIVLHLNHDAEFNIYDDNRDDVLVDELPCLTLVSGDPVDSRQF